MILLSKFSEKGNNAIVVKQIVDYDDKCKQILHLSHMDSND